MSLDPETKKDGALELPSPLCAKEGDRFQRIVFDDDVPFIMQPGGFVYVLLDVRTFAGLHVLSTQDGPTIVSLSRIASNLIHVESYHSSYPSYDCKESELEIIGVVWELFPTGDPQRRWILYQEGLEYNPPYERMHLSSRPEALEKALLLSCFWHSIACHKERSTPDAPHFYFPVRCHSPSADW